MNRGKHSKKREGEKQQKQKPKRGRPVLRWIGYILFGAVYLYVSTALWIFQGPFPALKGYLIDSLDATRHGYLLRPLSLYTLPESVIQQNALSNQLVSTTKNPNDIVRKNYDNHNGSIQVITDKESLFTAYIMLVKDPKRIRVQTTKYLHQHGQTVSDMVKESGAVAGINGGGFVDTNQQGTGAYPQGITIHDGQLVSITGSTTRPQPVIAFTAGGQMIAGAYSLPQLRSLNVKEAVGFGPVLVQDGKAVPTEGSEGRNPRTAIGQAADGTVIMIVTNGREINQPGATYDDIKALMLKYHATIAANLDGGSSTTMVYNGKLVNTPWDVLGEREVSTSIVVMPESDKGGQ
ncbi:exopolysaccharide biosynthesis protein [Alicyclobacillus acidoterrestris]|uniref:phosphodiester glycosidase family protein n=1 Tax=Alicyclobacillus suci TaxID=2816080 RepID=UPI001194B891|nr:phosphodiester glycosidase family protein [Alicyclobacillus suci]GEO26080.1 exopolysaccharide biosynthesis protein [Alicyclobacillus acidoterrestris]